MYEELVTALRKRAHDLPEKFSKNAENIDLFLKAADAIEKLSKERKTGEWSSDYDGYSDGEPVYDMWWCSECGTYFDEWDDKPTWNFCPNCGADMRQRLKEGERCLIKSSSGF